MALLPKQTILYLPELFKAIQEAPDRLTRQKMLVEYAQKDANHARALRSFTELMWYPGLEIVLPDGTPPHVVSADREEDSPSTLFRVFKEFGRFLKGDANFINNTEKREKYFVTQLEALSKREAALLVAIKDKKVHKIYDKVTCDLFCQVFGQAGWLPKDVVEANPPVEELPLTKKQDTSSEDSTQK